jgi:cytochrome c oxidase subunit 3
MPVSLTRDAMEGPPPAAGEWRGGRDGRGAGWSASLIALYVLLGATTMVFGAFTLAFVFRRGFADDWGALRKPPILWLNTAVLLASSLALELSRRALKAGDGLRFKRWWSAGTGLGMLFLAGQAVAWHQLRQAGVFVATNTSSSCFYVLTATHAFHLLGGLAALVYVGVQAWRLRWGPSRRIAIHLAAVFWHFLDGLWVYLMILFYAWG